MIKLKDLYPNQASFQKEAKDHEGKMAKSQLERSMEYSKMIYKIIQNVGKGGEVSLPAWVQSKLTKSMDYLQSVYNYLDGKDGLDDKFQEENIKEDMNPRRYSEIKGQARYLAMEMKSLNKAIRTQNDKDVVDSIDYILGKAKMMKEILTDKRYD